MSADGEVTMDNVTTLRKPDGGTVYLLGTCHVSSSSGSQAAELVQRTRPSTVVLELCADRSSLLSEVVRVSDSAVANVTDGGFAIAQSSSKTFAGIAGELGSTLADWTHLIRLQYDALDGLSAPQGAEFREAAAGASRVGARVVLGDRSVHLTTRRLNQLTPKSELLMALLFEDPIWVEAQSIERHGAALRLQQLSSELAAEVAAPPGPEREARLRSLSAAVGNHAEDMTTAAIPSFADAVISGLLRRFWCKEVIGEAERARLRAALDACHRIDPLVGMSMPPTMRQVLLDERDVVLAESLKKAPGDVVVGVVGKAHMAGIAAVWHEDTSARLAHALEEPRPPIGTHLAMAAAAVALPIGAYRYRVVRYAMGAGTLAVAGGGAWFVNALRDRLAFYERSQREQRSRQAAAGCA